MRTAKLGSGVVLVACLTMGTAGCGLFEALELLNAVTKVGNGQISQLTASELVAMNATAVGVINASEGTNLTPMTGDQAGAVITFLQANSINTVEDIEALGQNDQSQIVGLEALGAAFQGSDTDIDPNNFNPDELDDLLASIFTGNSGGG